MSAKARERVMCKECDLEIIHKNLQPHFRRFHPNCKPSYKMIIDSNQSPLNSYIIQKKAKQNKETDESTEKLTDESLPSPRKNYEDMDEEEQNFEQTLILISGATSYEQLKDFTRKHFKYMDNQFMCEACSHPFEIVDINERKKFSNLKVSLKRHLTLTSYIKNVDIYDQPTKQRERIC